MMGQPATARTVTLRAAAAAEASASEALPCELGAEVALTFAPGGLSHRIALPAACVAPDTEVEDGSDTDP